MYLVVLLSLFFYLWKISCWFRYFFLKENRTKKNREVFRKSFLIVFTNIQASLYFICSVLYFISFFLFTCLFVFELKILNKHAFRYCLVYTRHVKVQRSSVFQNIGKVNVVSITHIRVVNVQCYVTYQKVITFYVCFF